MREHRDFMRVSGIFYVDWMVLESTADYAVEGLLKDSKCVWRVTATRVRIPPSPYSKSHHALHDGSYYTSERDAEAGIQCMSL